MKRTPSLLFSALSLTLIVGCGGDPTARFEAFVERATTTVKAEKELINDYEFGSIKFDVEKTDSTISPYTAKVLISAVYKPAAAEDVPSGDDELSRLLRPYHDYGDRTYLFMYAYQEDEWVLKDAKAEGSDRKLGVIGPPKKLTEHFTP